MTEGSALLCCWQAYERLIAVGNQVVEKQSKNHKVSGSANGGGGVLGGALVSVEVRVGVRVRVRVKPRASVGVE